jgi:hypothetical protein
MRIGYACIALGLKDSAMRGCILKNANPDRLDRINRHELAYPGTNIGI